MMVTRRAVAIGGVLRGMRCTVRAMLSSSALGGPRAAAVRQEELLQALRAHVMEPVSQKDIVSVGALQVMQSAVALWVNQRGLYYRT